MRNFKARLSKLKSILSPERSCIKFTGLIAHLLANIGLKP